MRGPTPLTEECATCPLAKDGKPSLPVLGVGPAAPRLVIVGEGPGHNETREGLPFVGASGRLLMQTLGRVELRRDEVWITNATLCLPKPGDKESQVERATTCCNARLRRELSTTGTVPIVTLGVHAGKALVGEKFKLAEMLGTLHDLDGRHVVTTIHPAAVLRGQGEGTADLGYWSLLYHLGMAARLARGDQKKFDPLIEVEGDFPSRGEELVERAACAARQVGWLAVDTETDSLDPTTAKLTAIGLATRDFGVAVGMDALRTPRGLAIVRDLLADIKVAKVFHNRVYDTVVLPANGFPLGGEIHCTLLAHHSAFPGLGHGLQVVAAQFLAVAPWKSEFRAGDKALLPYCAMDTVATAQLHPILQHCVKRAGAEKTYVVDLKMAEVAAQMTRWGIPVDPDINQKLAERFIPVIEAMRSKFKAQAEAVQDKVFDLLAAERARRRRKADDFDFMVRHGARLTEAKKQIAKEGGFNIDSADQVVAVCKALGVPLNAYTDGGKTSTSKEVLEANVTHEIVQDLLRFRESAKLFSTFVAPIPALTRDGRIYPSWSVNKITGRWSSSPNCQNWSKGDKKKDIPNLRDQVVAPPGRMFVGADFKQLEARIVALLSREVYLCEAFTAGIDIHTEFARVIFKDFGDFDPDTRKKVRDHVKRAEYGYLYGAAPNTVWQALVKEGHKVPLTAILGMFKTFQERLPAVAAWHQHLTEVAAAKGELRSFLHGRRRVFPLGSPDPTVVKNFVVQSSAADITNTAVERLWNTRTDDIKILIQAHDAIIIECDAATVDRAASILADAMTQEYTEGGVTMKFDVDLKTGRSWADV